jgi:hypothetical protein
MQSDMSMFQRRNLNESILKDFKIPDDHKQCGGATIWSCGHRLGEREEWHMYIGYNCDCKKAIFYVCTLDGIHGRDDYSLMQKYSRK